MEYFRETPIYDSYDWLTDCLTVNKSKEWFEFNVVIKEVIFVINLALIIESIANLAKSCTKYLKKKTRGKNNAKELLNINKEYRNTVIDEYDKEQKVLSESIKYFTDEQENGIDHKHQIERLNNKFTENSISKEKTLNFSLQFDALAQLELKKGFDILFDKILAGPIAGLTLLSFEVAIISATFVAMNDLEGFDHSSQVSNNGGSLLNSELYFWVADNTFRDESYQIDVKSIDDLEESKTDEQPKEATKETIDTVNSYYYDELFQPISPMYMDNVMYDETGIVTSLDSADVLNNNLANYLNENNQYICTDEVLYIPFDEEFSNPITGEGIFDYISPKTKQVIIGEGYESIPENAFKNNTNIESVTLPTTLKSIGDYAFSGCSSLGMVSFTSTTPPAVHHGQTIFEGCGPVILYVPGGCQEDYQKWATENNIVPNPKAQVTSCYIDFKDCGTYYEVANIVPAHDSTWAIIPQTYKGKPVTGIADNACNYNKYPISIYLPDTITSIGNYAFEGAKINFMRLSKNLEKVGDYAFCCSNLKYIKLPDNIKTIGKSAFEDCQSLEKVIMPENCEVISNNLFKYCKNLKHVEFANQVTKIGNGAFMDCQSLKTLNFSKTSLNQIDNYAFDGCNQLKTVIFPATLKQLGNNIFNGCTNIKNLVFSANYKYWGSSCATQMSVQSDTFKALPKDARVFYEPSATPKSTLEQALKNGGWVGWQNTGIIEYSEVKNYIENYFSLATIKKEISTFYFDLQKIISTSTSLISI